MTAKTRHAAARERQAQYAGENRPMSKKQALAREVQRGQMHDSIDQALAAIARKQAQLWRNRQRVRRQ
jgi:hypothetical protein